METTERNIRKLAALKDMTLKELAKKAGIAESTLHTLFKRGDASTKVMLKIAEALEVDMERLYESDGTAIKSYKKPQTSTSDDLIAAKDALIEELKRDKEFLKSLLAERLGRIEERLSVGKDDAASIIEMYPEKKPGVMKVTRAS
ncbi:helix-turn-helix transcriptional regulator [Rhodoflexus caldus]|uniref:helix-turn-helix transcriptional regulator n=1 Tax=Rhodoflexus caldus TaxID=2891236 RepID=UPI00202A710D|nr:helix-turn-helix transcriptional regulator [Rhodoflexus caldus]